MHRRDAMAHTMLKLIKPKNLVWFAAGTGALVDLRARVPDLDDPATGATWDAARTVPAELLAELLVGTRPPLRGGRLRAVRLRGARITGQLNLEATTLACPLLLQDCHLEQPISLNQARAQYIGLPGCHLPGLTADQLETRGNLVLDCSSVSGEARLLGAHIGGQLRFNGTTLTNPDGPTLNADEITVDQGVFCKGFTATGEMRMVGAHIRGTLELDGASLTNPNGRALNADRLTVDQDMLCRQGFRGHSGTSIRVTVRAPRWYREAGCSPAARRPAWRRRRTAPSPGHSGSAAADTPPARRSSVPPSTDGGPAAGTTRSHSGRCGP
jgi:hypothetical protein